MTWWILEIIFIFTFYSRSWRQVLSCLSCWCSSYTSTFQEAFVTLNRICLSVQIFYLWRQNVPDLDSCCCAKKLFIFFTCIISLDWAWLMSNNLYSFQVFLSAWISLFRFFLSLTCSSYKSLIFGMTWFFCYLWKSWFIPEWHQLPKYAFGTFIDCSFSNRRWKMKLRITPHF